jgi:hypothetical protein
MLDQFGTGLEILDVLSAVRANPAAFEALFVTSSKRLTPDAVKKIVRLKSIPNGCPQSLTVFSIH